MIVTGRPERTRSDSVEWLRTHGVEIGFQSRLPILKDGDGHEDHAVRRDMLNDIRNVGFEPVLVFDDRQLVVHMWRNQDNLVAQIATSDF